MLSAVKSNFELSSLEEFKTFIRTMPKEKLKNYDTYCLSSAYYEFTGRNGLRVYKKNESFLISCLHPNKPGTTLVFPEVSLNGNYELTFEVLKEKIDLGNRIQLARFTATQRLAIKTITKENGYLSTIKIEDVDEEILDWKYPIYILNTEDVLLRKGGRFEQLRQRLRKLDRSTFTIRQMNFPDDQIGLYNLVVDWAKSHKNYCLEEDLISPFKKLLTMFERYPDCFYGQVILIDDCIKSYCILEKSIHDSSLANQFAIASFNSINGLSEWQVVSACEIASSLGIQKINIGGSETHGLDRFKRKFSPIESIQLYSMLVHT